MKKTIKVTEENETEILPGCCLKIRWNTWNKTLCCREKQASVFIFLDLLIFFEFYVKDRELPYFPFPVIAGPALPVVGTAHYNMAISGFRKEV
jgi:hypothetical protein